AMAVEAGARIRVRQQRVSVDCKRCLDARMHVVERPDQVHRAGERRDHEQTRDGEVLREGTARQRAHAGELLARGYRPDGRDQTDLASTTPALTRSNWEVSTRT